MPDTLSLQPGSFITDAQRRQEAADRAAREDYESGIAAALQTTPIADFVNGFARMGFDPDPNFKWTRPLVDEFSDGIDTDLVPQLGRAVSADHAQLIRAQLLIKSDHRRNLANLGWKGQALAVAANLIDPTMLAVGVVTGGVGELAAAGAATRAARLTRMGLITGGGFAGLETARSAFNPEIGASEILASGLSGFGFGVGGELTRGAGRLARAGAIGVGGAVGPAAVDAIGNQFRDEEERRSILWNGATNVILGGLLSVMTPAQRRRFASENPALYRASEKISDAGRRMQRDVEYDSVKSDGATPTARGEKYFKEQIGRREERVAPLVEHAAELAAMSDEALMKMGPRLLVEAEENALRQTEIISRLRKAVIEQEIDSSFATAESRLAAFSPDHKLNREEVAAVLEGTGYKPGNQGFPSPEEMRTKLADLKREAAGAAIERETIRTSTFLPSELRGRAGGTEPAVASAPEVATVATSKQAAKATEVANEVAAIESPLKPTSADVVQVIEKEHEFKPGVQSPAMGAATPEVGEAAPANQMKVGDMDFTNVTDAEPSRPRFLPRSLSRIPESVPLVGGKDVGALPRFDPAGMVGRSTVPLFRKAINIFAKDPLPKADGTPSIFSAPEQAQAKTISLRGRALARIDAAYTEHVNAKGDLSLSREAFNEQVSRAWRRISTPGVELDPAARQAAEAVSALVEEVHAFAKRHGVPGFEAIKHEKSHVPVLWRQDLLDPHITRFTQDQLVAKLLAPAILGGEWKLTAEQAISMARAIIKNGGRKLSASELERGRLFADDPSRLAAALADANPKLTDAEIAAIVGRIMPRREGAGTPSVAKQRISMDHTFEADLVDPATNEVVRVGVEDLMENNVETLVSKYAHQLYGASALSKGLKSLFAGRENPPITIGGAIDALRREANAFGVKNAETDLKRLETVMKITAGVPLYEDNATRQVLRSITNMNYLRTMSNAGTGLQNFAEINQGMNELGWANVASHLPPATEIFKRAADGTMTTPMLRELEAIGIGLDHVVNRVGHRMLGDDGVLLATGRAEYWSARGARLASDISLQSFGQVVMESAVAPAVMQKFADMARGGRPMGKFRLLGSGLDEGMASRISDEINANAVFKQDGTKLYDLRVEDWKDVEAASAFRGAVLKITHRLALKVNATEMANWMHTDAGRLMTFLRKFLIGSYTNKTLFEYAAKDSIAATNVVIGLLATGLTYTARTYINSIGRPDADEYRQKMLSPERIATAAIGRAPFSSFIPAAVDTATDLTGRPQVFSHARTSGLKASLITGNPLVDWGMAIYNTPRAFIGPIWSDYDFSKDDLENVSKGFFIPNIVGVRPILEQMGVGLPAKSRSE